MKKFLTIIWEHSKQFGLTLWGWAGSLSVIYSLFNTEECRVGYWFCMIFAGTGAVVHYIIKTWIIKQAKVVVNNNTTIEVREQNIFTSPANSVRVIPVNNYFDTQVDDKVINKSTLHGQFVDYITQNYPKYDLDAEIAKSIAQEKLSPVKTVKQRSNLNDSNHNKAYKLGSTIELQIGPTHYYLVVASEFDKNNHIKPQPSKHYDVLIGVADYILKHNHGVPVYMPVIGSGRTNYDIPLQKMLENQLHSLMFIPNLSMGMDSVICIAPNEKRPINYYKLKQQSL